MSEKLTKKEAMALLKISSATMTRWMQSGKIKYTKIPAAHFAPGVFFDCADLAPLIPCEPVITPLGFEQSLPVPKPVPKPAPVPQDKRTWAEKYADGDECDSCGNYIHGENPRWPETGATLLGPAISQPVQRQTGTQRATWTRTLLDEQTDQQETRRT